jgi:hypothetical protein
VGKQWSGGSGMGRQVDEAEGGGGLAVKHMEEEGARQGI